MNKTSIIMALNSVVCVYCEDVSNRYDYALGYRYQSSISDAQYNESPEWVPESDVAIPLSVNAAVVLANREFRNINKAHPDKWKLEFAKIAPVNSLFNREKWIYEIVYQYCPDVHTGPVSRISISVLMNGVVIKPIVDEWDGVNNRPKTR